MARRNRGVPNASTGALPAAGTTTGTRKRTTSRVGGRAQQWTMGQKGAGLDTQLYETLQASGCLSDINPAATQTIIRQFLQTHVAPGV